MGNPSQSCRASPAIYGITQCYLPTGTGECAQHELQIDRPVLDLPAYGIFVTCCTICGFVIQLVVVYNESTTN